ncbi:hypothetical protein [Actinokineospora sp.]|uniref:hypothetical protein n=1 Tax=Actinokineospora sp. TaxID=1872133 RepID=UPI00403818C1
MTAGTRLLDLVPLLDGDHRVQVVFTVPRTEDGWHGLDGFARRCGALVVPWDQAFRQEWDLVLSADHDCIERMHGNLLLLPHGAGAAKSRLRSRMVAAAVPTTGVDRELLTRRGRVIPAVIALPTESELGLVRRTCPEAASVAVVAGDICLDRLLASVPFRARYREALGVGAGTDLITISSTWSPESTFGTHPELYERLLREIGHDDTRVAAVLHPNVWAVHGAWQVRAWLARAIERGLLVIPPERGWQAAMVAADLVLGDHGSTSVYAAALGTRTCLAAFPEDNIRPGSVAHVMGRTAPRLDHTRPLRPQLAAVGPFRRASRLRAAISSRPGRTHQVLRAAMYRLLDLPEPSWPASVTPVPAALPISW